MASSFPLADTCQHPAPPIITGSARAICRNEAVTLTATGCIGTIIWSNGEVGNTITVQPQQTTKYTAICRARPGCISCFADVWQVAVNTSDAPVITPSSKLICANDVVTLSASNCTGTVRWADQDRGNQTTGLTWAGNLTQTTTFRAVCEQNNCVSNASTAVAVQVGTPTVPLVTVDKKEICAGQAVQLIASGCLGNIRWSDEIEGVVRTVTPAQTTRYQAVCQTGSCRSDSSEAVTVVVRSSKQRLNLITTLTNACPFQTADLSKAITGSADGALNTHYTFRTGLSPEAPVVQSPGAVQAGTYYVYSRDSAGCYTDPVAVTVTIQPCQNAIPACLSDPARVTVRLDSLDWP